MTLCLLVAGVLSVQAQQPSTVDQRLAATCQEQLVDAEGAMSQVLLPDIGFKAKTLYTLNRKLGEAQQQQARDAATISALRQELDVLKQPTSPPGDTRGPDTPAARE